MAQSARSAWIVGIILVFLVAAVAVQGYWLFQLHQKLPASSGRIDRTVSYKEEPATPPPEAIPPAPRSATPRPAPPRSFWDEWFARPFSDDWDPFAEMERMREEMLRMMDESLQRFHRSPLSRQFRLGPPSFAPRTDIEDAGDRYIVRMDLPGVEKANISVQIEGQTLSVTGKTAEERREEDASGRYLRQERRTGQFQRVVTLPGPVQSDKMEAKYADGVLTITVPKASPRQEPRRVIVL